MTLHIPHEAPDARREFLVDGCPRCAEYVEDLGLQFDAARFRVFWLKMIAVEFDDVDHWHSESDKRLGRRLYYVALALRRAFGFDPHILPATFYVAESLPDAPVLGADATEAPDPGAATPEPGERL